MPVNRIVAPLRRPQETEEVAALVARVIETLPYYNERAKAEELAKYGASGLHQAVAGDPGAVLVVHEDERIAGFCISEYDDGLIWLAWFGTHPGYRGRGIGHDLLEALAATLPERRAHKVWCDTRTDNTPSQRVLKRFGFRQVAELRNHWHEQDFYLWEWSPQ